MLDQFIAVDITQSWWNHDVITVMRLVYNLYDINYVMNWAFHRGRVTWKHNLIRQITLLWLVYAQPWFKYGEFGSIFWEFWVEKSQGTPYVWPNRKCLTTSRRVKIFENFKIFPIFKFPGDGYLKNAWNHFDMYSG